MKSFSFTDFPEINTERLLLRQLNDDDADAVFKLRSNTEINKLITRKTPKNTEEATEFIAVCQQEFKKENRIFWTMELNETNQVIGTIVFHKISLDDNYAEIGYELHPTFHRKGFMNEAMQVVLKFGKATLQLKIIEAFTHQNNKASIALLEKHHFVFQPKRRDEGFENNRIFRLEINQ
ncbi:Putative ribosomal N-acetyltransferase YdaF [Polaribacter huanghezhanensis]|uniref:GNAT family N-acetyltransferase n=1 Tax=Polaribacter huanghezhanensis TaxID=1354726 RepID=UPI00264857F0|nr:GNAT family N-acetyltransferase [Polaribacter huanghezhanensis]WKD86318.1 Putative ribosomal N-acetyltransferase YdaF [Polaribacter huanghezhanensis]